MADSNPYSERYRNHSAVALLRILRKAGQYEPLAVAAAKAELEKRSPEEKAAAEEELREEAIAGEVRQLKRKEIRQNASETASKFNSIFRPQHEGDPQMERGRSFRVSLVLMIGAIYLYKLFNDFSLALFIVDNGFKRFEFFDLQVLAQYVLAPVGLLLFGLRKKAGWYVLTILLGLEFFPGLCLMLHELMRKHETLDGLIIQFRHPIPVTLWLGLLLWASLLGVLQLGIIRRQYHVTVNESIALTTGLLILSVVLFWK